METPQQTIDRQRREIESLRARIERMDPRTNPMTRQNHGYCFICGKRDSRVDAENPYCWDCYNNL